MNKIDRILNKINDLNCELMTNIYDNKIENSTKIFVKNNKNNFIGYITYKGIKLNGNVQYFSKNNPYTIDNIKIFLKDKNLILKSEEFKSSGDYLLIECPIHGIYKSTWDNLKQGFGCKKCGVNKRAEKRKKDYNDVKNNLIKYGYKIINENYNNSHELLNLIDNEGYKFKVSYSSIISGYNPIKFIKSNPYTIENIKLFLSKNYKDFILLEKEYCDAHTNMKFYCNKHKCEFYATWNNISKGKGCYKCGIEKRSGENNCNYNPNLSDKERELKRYTYGKETYNNWRKSIFERDNYTCIITGKKGRINAHHLNGWMWDKENRFNINNGVTLHEDIHKEFHKMYGNKNNTIEQFLEFYKYKTGKDFIINMTIPSQATES